MATRTTATCDKESSSWSTESPRLIQTSSGRRASSPHYYQVRLSLRAALSLTVGSLVLPHLAGRWVQQHHRTVWAATIREMGTTAIILQFLPILDENTTSRNTTSRRHQEEHDEAVAAKTPAVFEATSGSSVVHHWYSNSSTTTTITTNTVRAAVQGQVLPVGGPPTCKNDEKTISNSCCVVDGISPMSPTASSYSSSSSSSGEDHHHHHRRRHHHHEPAAAALFLGHHLLVDLDRVGAAFLASEARLVQALVQLAADNSWTMLSYHCHNNSNSSDGSDDNNNKSSFGGHDGNVVVSCVAVLLESHVSLHAFPGRGILALDIFTRRRDSPALLSLLPNIETMFGGMSSSRALFGGDDFDNDDGSEPSPPPSRPRMAWSHKRRGFTSVRHEGSDYHRMLGNKNDEKIQVLRETTAVQDVQIVDITDGAGPVDRALYLDGVLQSRRLDEAVYHEALFHAAMVVHPHPKRVAVVGGGTGAILREVLKHNTVEEVVMMEMDERLVAIAREHLPEWSDCTFLVGSSPTATSSSCFDDPRVTIMVTDAVVWFMKQFGSATSSSTNGADEPFDVIILDAL
jgi:S-adenosylmethionine/arginine decarboxylase-like enzyme